MPSYEELLEQNALLKFENDQLKKLIYSSKKERHASVEVPAEQGNLFNQEPPSEESEAATETITYNRKKASSHKGRNKLPSHLPVQEVIIEPDVDTSDMDKIGEEVTETLDYTPASLRVIRTRRIKYAKKTKASIGQDGDQQIFIAPPLQRPINKLSLIHI